MIRDREYEVALSLGRRWAIGFLLWLNGIPQRIGYETGTYRFLSRTVPLNLEQYAAWMYHDLVKGLEIKTPCPKIQDSINVPTQDIAWAEEKQTELGIKDSGYILIHGGSSNLAKRQGIDKIYPVEKWKQVMENIQTRQPDIPIVIVQGPEDEDWVKQIQGLVGNLKVVAPDDIGKLAAMIAGANLMICTDSAPMHLSIAVDTYTVALFGPTNAEKLLPPDQTKFIGVQSPTDNIADIAPEEILKQIWRD
jgi:ADP-heptose:LPS heptosyltransferase